MTDIHTHILPLADDGSRSEEESLKMIETEIRGGVTEVIFTPHYSPRRGYTRQAKELIVAYERFCSAVRAKGYAISLGLGQEIEYGFSAEIPGMLERGELLTLNKTEKVLLEFSAFRRPEGLTEIGYRFSLYGYTVIVAHAELYPWMREEDLQALKADGCLIQIDGGSLLEGMGSERKKRAKRLLASGIADYVASDIHWFRPCDWDKIKRKVKKYAAGKNLFRSITE